jgi:hypothetical protein
MSRSLLCSTRQGQSLETWLIVRECPVTRRSMRYTTSAIRLACWALHCLLLRRLACCISGELLLCASAILLLSVPVLAMAGSRKSLLHAGSNEKLMDDSCSNKMLPLLGHNAVVICVCEDGNAAKLPGRFTSSPSFLYLQSDTNGNRGRRAGLPCTAARIQYPIRYPRVTVSILPNVGSFVRPFGGWFLGRLADRHGRKHTLMISIFLTCSGSLD